MSPGRNIVLIGYRGAGKTTVGREIAHLAGARFVDSDDHVARQAGCTITEIFIREREEGFRQRERLAIEELLAEAARCGTPTVLAVGGGAVLDARNVMDLRAFGAVVWLRADREELARRVAADPASHTLRPPLTKYLNAAATHAPPERESLYASCAHITIDVGGLTAAQVAQSILDRLPSCPD